MLHGEIQHRRGAKADRGNGGACFLQPFQQCRFHRGGADAPIITHGDAGRFGAVAAAHEGGEGTAQCARIRRVQRFADDAANVVFTQQGRIETMGGHGDFPEGK